jgi:multiple sugar transport system permease protein
MNFSRFTLLGRIGSRALLWLLTVAVGFPLLWLTVSVFKPSSQIIANPLSLPKTWSLGNITGAWGLGDFTHLYVNSVVITVVSVLGILVVEGLAAYAFARLRFRGRAVLFAAFVAGQLVPAQVVVLPSAVEMSKLGLSDTLLALVLQYMSWAPFAILFLTAAMLAVPRELEEAARVDGAGHLTIIFQIILPLTKSAFATVATVYALWIWNDFLFPLVYLHSSSNFTVPLGLAQFQGAYTTFWGYLVGAIFVTIWPPLVVYAALSRQIQSRLSFTGVRF